MSDTMYNTLTPSAPSNTLSDAPSKAALLAAETAKSYLDDVREQTEALDRVDNSLTVSRMAGLLIDGDLRLARQEAEQAPKEERLDLLASCNFREGLICIKRATAFRQFVAIPEKRKEREDFLLRAAYCFHEAAQQSPEPAYHYNLGLTLLSLNKNWEAVQAFEQAMNGDDPRIAMDARKEIGRLGAVSPPAPSPSPIAPSPSPPVSVVSATQADAGAVQQAHVPAVPSANDVQGQPTSQKTPNWNLVGGGAIAAFVGFLMLGSVPLIGGLLLFGGLCTGMYGLTLRGSK